MKEYGLRNGRNRDYESAKTDEEHFNVTFRGETEENF